MPRRAPALTLVIALAACTRTVPPVKNAEPTPTHDRQARPEAEGDLTANLDEGEPASSAGLASRLYGQELRRQCARDGGAFDSACMEEITRER